MKANPEIAGNVARAIADLRRESRRLRRAMVGIVALIGLAIGAQWMGHASRLVAADKSSPVLTLPDSILRVRGLIVVDRRGTERVWIGAPLPDPVLLGQRSKRGDPVSGILIFDAEGNERGGYVTGDSTRDAALTLDEVGRAAVVLYTDDRGDMGLSFGDQYRNWMRFGLNPNGPHVTLGRRGTVRLVLPDTAAASPGTNP